MKIFGFEIPMRNSALVDLGLDRLPRDEKAAQTVTLDTLIRRMEAVFQTTSGAYVSPETCMESPTVHAIVTGISKGISSLSLGVYEKSIEKGLTSKEPLPNHSVAKLLNYPNDWQSANDYWLDAVSAYLRYGAYCASIGRGVTGPIRRLTPLITSQVEAIQNLDYSVQYRVTSKDGSQRLLQPDDLHIARSTSRDFFSWDSPVVQCREAIAYEIAAQKFGASFFGNGAMPGIIFQFMEGFKGYNTDEERRAYIQEFQNGFANNQGRFKGLLLPKGIEVKEQIGVENDKAQFIESRKYQRTVICGAFGVPLYLAGDLERQTFNNAEQQSTNKIVECLLPIIRSFEAAMWRDLLTQQDRNAGIIVRFNVDAALRGDYQSRTAGYKIMREVGAMNPNEIRELENMNPRPGGDAYWDQGPSGQGKPGQAQPAAVPPAQNEPPPSSNGAGGKYHAYV